MVNTQVFRSKLLQTVAQKWDVANADFPGYRQANVAPAFGARLLGRHTFSIEAAGDLAPTAPPPGNQAVCDPQRLLDLLLYVEMTL